MDIELESFFSRYMIKDNTYQLYKYGMVWYGMVSDSGKPQGR